MLSHPGGIRALHQRADDRVRTRACEKNQMSERESKTSVRYKRSGDAQANQLGDAKYKYKPETGTLHSLNEMIMQRMRLTQ